MDWLFRCSAQTLIEIAADPVRLGAEIGFFSVLHTWNQKLQHHPHVHCVVAAGGLSGDHTHWVRLRSERFFLPKDVLSEVFRGKAVEAFQQAYASGQLHFHGLLHSPAQPKLFRSLIRQIHAPATGGPPPDRLSAAPSRCCAISALIPIALRFPIAGSFPSWMTRSRFAGGTPLIKTRNDCLTLSADEFLRRFLLHKKLPRGFVRIRHFGFLASAKAAADAAPALQTDSCGRILRNPHCGNSSQTAK